MSLTDGPGKKRPPSPFESHLRMRNKEEAEAQALTASSANSTSSTTKEQSKSTFSSDLLASVVVFLVALPLCMGISIASGLTPAHGIVTGIIGGIVVGFLGGSPMQVSGPAAGLAVVVLELIKEHGTERLGVIICLAGIVQIIAGCLKAAPWFRAVPPAVINGMLSGIGVLIFAAQFHVMVDDSPKGSGINNLLSIPSAIWKGLNVPGTGAAETTHHLAAAVGLVTVIILILWQKFASGRLKVLPGSLVAVLLATGFSTFLALPVRYVAIPDNLFASLTVTTIGDFQRFFSTEVLLDAVAIAFIATAETLLTCAALDKLHNGPRTNYDRELVGQGIGNSLCGLVGCLPLTGVMVRSGVNLAAGAKTRLSCILHGFWILLFVVVFPHVLEHIPTSSLAALLVFTGYKMVNFKVIKDMRKYGRSEALIYLATVILIVCEDLLTGVIAGVVLSVCKLLYMFSHLEIKLRYDPKRNRTHVSLSGAATFLSLPKLADTVDRVKGDSELHIHLEDLEYIDHACLDLLMNWDKQHRAAGGTLVMDWGALGTVFRERRKGTRGENREFRAVTESEEDEEVSAEQESR